jgi:hypothetical protein
MNASALAGLFCGALMGAGAYVFVSQHDKPTVTGSVQSQSPVINGDPRIAINVVKVDWRREGFGLTSVADVSVRNNNGYAVRVDRISCRFRSKDGGVEDHTQGVYDIVQSRAERTIHNVSLGFVNADAKGIDCSVVGARKDF